MYLNTHKSYLQLDKTLKYLEEGLFHFKPKGIWLGDEYIGTNKVQLEWVKDFRLNYVPRIMDLLDAFERFKRVNQCRECGVIAYDNMVKAITEILNEFYSKEHRKDDYTVFD